MDRNNFAGLRNRGFTLVQLIVSVVVASVLVGLAVPSFSEVIRKARLTSTVNELVASVHYARSEAIKRNTDVVVKSKAGNWSNGWTVELSPCVGACVLRDHEVLASPYTLTGSDAVITYHGNGATEKTSKFVLCYGNTVKAGYVKGLIISFVGLSRIATDINGDGIPELNGVNVSSCV